MPACAWLDDSSTLICLNHKHQGFIDTPEAKLTGASCVCSCPCGCALPKKLGEAKALLEARPCPKPPNAGVLAAPKAGVLDAKLNVDELAPNAGVVAPPKPKAGVLAAAPNAGDDAAPNAGVELPPKLNAELLAGAEPAPKAGVLKLPKREGVLAGAPGAAAAEALAKLNAGAGAAAAHAAPRHAPSKRPAAMHCKQVATVTCPEHRVGGSKLRCCWRARCAKTKS